MHALSIHQKINKFFDKYYFDVSYTSKGLNNDTL